MNLSIFIIFTLLAICKTVVALWTQIPTGFVGVTIVFGKVTPPLMYAGLNFYNPLTTSVILVEIRPQTDAVIKVDCVTNEGIPLVFEKIEIGNKLDENFVLDTISRFGNDYDHYLVTDLVRHEVNVLCSQKGTNQLAVTEFDQLDDHIKGFLQSENDRQKSGLEISFVRLTKPKMPHSIELNYLALAEEKTKTAVVLEERKKQEAQQESERIASEKVAEIEQQKAMAEQKRQKIVDETQLSTAEANFKKKKLDAAGVAAFYDIPKYAEVELAGRLSAGKANLYVGMPNMQTFLTSMMGMFDKDKMNDASNIAKSLN